MVRVSIISLKNISLICQPKSNSRSNRNKWMFQIFIQYAVNKRHRQLKSDIILKYKPFSYETTRCNLTDKSTTII